MKRKASLLAQECGGKVRDIAGVFSRDGFGAQ
jgi:hypothetical protein